MRSLRRLVGIGPSRPSSEDRSLAQARRPGLSATEILGRASPLRDSAGISPASLCTAPAQGHRSPGMGESYRRRGASFAQLMRDNRRPGRWHTVAGRGRRITPTTGFR